MSTENNRNHSGRDESTGKYLPGNSGKPFGATKNKTRDKIRKFIADEWVNFPTWFSKLKEEKKIEVYLSLLPYDLGRLQNIAVTDSEGNDVTQRAVIDYTKLPEPLSGHLKEILDATTIQNGTQHEE